MFKSFVKICSAVFASIILLTLVACGSTANEASAKQSESDDEGSLLLIGVYRSSEDNGEYYEADISVQDVITLYRVHTEVNTDTNIESDSDSDTYNEETEEVDSSESYNQEDVETSENDENKEESSEEENQKDILWVGSFAKPEDDDADVFFYESQRDDEATMEYESDTMVYTYYADDDKLCFTREDGQYGLYEIVDLWHRINADGIISLNP